MMEGRKGKEEMKIKREKEWKEVKRKKGRKKGWIEVRREKRRMDGKKEGK
jgi:hypothetical protein